MFDGDMPPSGRGPRGPFSVGTGNQAVPQSLPVLATPVAPATGIAEWRWDRAEPRCVQLAFPAVTAGPNVPFPPVQGNHHTSCGLVDLAGSPLGTAQAWLAAVIEYGCGAASQKLYCDWQPGAFNLPPSDFVRVSALGWGDPAVFTNQLQVQASIATGTVDGCHVPTATGRGLFTAGVARNFQVPPGARAIAVLVADASLPVVTLRGSAWANFDFSAPAFTPGIYVVDVLDSDVVQIKASIDALLTVSWYLQP